MAKEENDERKSEDETTCMVHHMMNSLSSTFHRDPRFRFSNLRRMQIIPLSELKGMGNKLKVSTFPRNLENDTHINDMFIEKGVPVVMC